MKYKNTYLYLSITGIQLLLVFLAFPAMFLYPGNAMFAAGGDGLKNYFTLSSYIKEPIGYDGILKYNVFNYPFGDYVYYTDNSPLFSIPFRFFCRHAYDISAYTIPAFNFFILANIIFGALLVFFIFKKLVGINIFSYSLAIVLPWINIQVQRIWEGDFNLSCTPPILTAIILFMLWHYNKDNAKRQITAAICMVLLLFFSFLLHGYYFAIVATFLSGMLFFSGTFSFRDKYGKRTIIAAFLIPAIALGIIYLLLCTTDHYLNLRQAFAMGYDAVDLKTNFTLLFTHYDFHTIGFPVAATKPENGEMMVYLGNIGLFTLGTLWTGVVFSKNFRQRVFAIQKEFFSDNGRKAIFLGAIIPFAISFGEYYNTNREPLVFFTPFKQINDLGTDKLLIAIPIIALSIYAIILITSKKARQNLAAIKAGYAQHPWQKARLLFCIALTMYLFVARYTVHVPNLINPFFYLHFATRSVEQFRSLSRFSWPFFWAFYLWMMYILVQLYMQQSQKAKTIIVTAFILLGAVEVRDYIITCRHNANNTNVLADSNLKQFEALKIDFSQYQAILPIPYYTIGSEDYPHSIDDNGSWSTYTMWLHTYSHLPLMSCKMSRTPPEFSLALLDMVANDTLKPILKNRLNNKPILIAFEKNLVNQPGEADKCSNGREETKQYYLKAAAFVSRHHLSAIDSMGSVYFYSWKPE